jgi:hypothetical protein
MSITPLPSAPQPTDSTAEFNTKAFAWVAALDTFTTEANALASAVDADASAADADAAAAAISAATAEAAADTAVAAAGAVAWVSGTTYAIGNIVWSPITYLSYRRKTNGAGTTDPSADSTNWELISGNVTTTGVQTLTNKTMTGVKETKVAMAAVDIDLSAGNYFTKTITTTTTFTVTNTPTTGTAASFILDLTNGGSATITWWSGMDWAGGTAPTLTTAGRDTLGFFTYDGGTTWNGFVLGLDMK